MENPREPGNLYLDIDRKRLLKELPSFFQSFTETLSELVQNSYRARASQITIDIDADARTLKVVDDGTGAVDPSALLTAGKTGWDESVVVDPAGLGFFALLGCSDEVVVETRAEGHHGWRIELNQTCFEGQPVQYQPLAYDEGPHPRGMIITAKISSKSTLDINLNRSTFDTFRHFFPLGVTVNYKSHGVVLKKEYPYPDFSKAPCLETPVGKLYRMGEPSAASSKYLSQGGYYSYSDLKVRLVWEYRELSSSLASDLKHHLLKLEGGECVADAMRDVNYYVVINDACGVRPKLPDRREVIVDNNYYKMVEVLAAAIMADVDIQSIEAQVAAKSLPRIVQKEEVCELGIPLSEVKTSEVIALSSYSKLMLGGYKECNRPTYLEPCINGTWEDYSLDRDIKFFLTYKPLLVRDSEVASALCWNNIPAYYDPNGDDYHFKLYNPTRNSEWVIDYGACEKIELLDSSGSVVCNLSSLVEEGVLEVEIDGEFQEVRPYFQVISPREFLRGISDDALNEVFLGWAMCALYDAQELCEYLEDDKDYPGGVWFQQAKLRRELISDYASRLYADKALEFQRWERLCNLNDALSDLEREIRLPLMNLEQFVTDYPEVEEARALLEKLRALKYCTLRTHEWMPALETGNEEHRSCV